MYIAIKSLYGKWRGNAFKKLTGQTVYESVLILMNETDGRIVYSKPHEFQPGRFTDEIAANPGEAICIIHPGDEYSRVAVAETHALVKWIGHYFFTPQFARTLSVRDGVILIDGVPITLKILKSYPPQVRKATYMNILRKSHVSAPQKEVARSLLGC